MILYISLRRRPLFSLFLGRVSCMSNAHGQVPWRSNKIHGDMAISLDAVSSKLICRSFWDDFLSELLPHCFPSRKRTHAHIFICHINANYCASKICGARIIILIYRIYLEDDAIVRSRDALTKKLLPSRRESWIDDDAASLRTNRFLIKCDL